MSGMGVEGRRGKKHIFVEYLKYIQYNTVKVKYKNFRFSSASYLQ